MVNIGNNHMMDYGEKGLLDTIEALEAKEMAFIGAGRSDDEAYKAEVVDINGQKVAFLSFTPFFSRLQLGGTARTSRCNKWI